MRVISTWHQPSSVSHSVKLDENTLAVARVNRVDFLNLGPNGVSPRCGLEIWGKVSGMQPLKRLHGPPALLVTTDHPNPMALVLSSHPDTPSVLSVEFSASLQSRAGRRAEFFQGATAHQNGRVAAISTYIGTLNVIRTHDESPGQKPSLFECRIPELSVLSMAFLPGQDADSLTLAILFVDNHLQRRLVGRDLSLPDKELSVEPSQRLPLSAVQPGARLLVTIPGSPGRAGGILVLGGEKCQFFECLSLVAAGKQGRRDSKSDRQPTRKSSALKVSNIGTDLPYDDIVAYALVDPEGSNVLISDSFGRLSLLKLDRGGPANSVMGMTVTYIGEIPSPTTITYLNANVCYIGSHVSDSQIIRLNSPNPRSNDSCERIKVIESFKNIAPIMDAQIVELDGVRHVVTCSGGFNSGSINLIRNGADFEELATLEHIPRINKIFPLRNAFEAEFETLILLSSLYDTRLLSIGPDNEFEELGTSELPGLTRNTFTIAAGNMKGDVIAQVTKDAVVIIELQSGMAIHRWTSKDEITVADLNPTQIVVGTKGGMLIYLTFQEEQGLVHRGEIIPGHNGNPIEISSISINPISRMSPHSSNFVVFGLWGSNQVSICRLPDFTPFQSAVFPPETHLPRSVLLHSFETGKPGERLPYLLVGRADGCLVAYSLDHQNFSVKDRKLMLLGTRPIVLSLMRQNGSDESIVFACGSRPAAIFYANGRLQHSPLVLKDVGLAAPLYSQSFPSSLIFATRDTLIIGRIGELQKLHIRTIPFGPQNPRRIAHNPASRAFGVGFTRMYSDATQGVDPGTTAFKVLDDVTFQTLHAFTCEPNEEVTAVKVLELTIAEKTKTYFVVGTMFEEPGKTTTEKGRILVFEEGPADRREYCLLASHTVPGCVFAVAALGGKIAAAINSAVTVYSLESEATKPSNVFMEYRTTWNRGYHIICLAVRGDFVILGDAMRSLEYLYWSGHTFKSVSKDHSPLWPLSLETLDDQTVMVGEANGNLFTYNTEQGKPLERQGSYRLDDIVNKFEQGCVLSVSPNAAVRPSLMLFTTSGRIAIVSDLSDELSMLFTNLQRNLSYVLKGPGSLDHTTFRTTIGPRGQQIEQARGFVDGDFLERFLELDTRPKELQKVMSGNNEYERLKESREDIIAALEQLQALH